MKYLKDINGRLQKERVTMKIKILIGVLAVGIMCAFAVPAVAEEIYVPKEVISVTLAKCGVEVIFEDTEIAEKWVYVKGARHRLGKKPCFVIRTDKVKAVDMLLHVGPTPGSAIATVAGEGYAEAFIFHGGRFKVHDLEIMGFQYGIKSYATVLLDVQRVLFYANERAVGAYTNKIIRVTDCIIDRAKKHGVIAEKPEGVTFKAEGKEEPWIDGLNLNVALGKWKGGNLNEDIECILAVPRETLAEGETPTGICEPQRTSGGTDYLPLRDMRLFGAELGEDIAELVLALAKDGGEFPSNHDLKKIQAAEDLGVLAAEIYHAKYHPEGTDCVVWAVKAGKGIGKAGALESQLMESQKEALKLLKRIVAGFAKEKFMARECVKEDPQCGLIQAPVLTPEM